MEHVYSREMVKARRMARGLQRQKSIRRDFWVGRGTKRSKVKEAGEK